MDPFSHRLANALVGNPRHAATLELTLVGPELEIDDERWVAVTGARFVLTIDGAECPSDTACPVRPGSLLAFGTARQGVRAYLAISGGIDVAPTLGSRATHLLSRMGGLSGRAVKAGDRLPLGPVRGRNVPARHSGRGLTLPDGRARVRFLPGPQRKSFVDDAIEVLQSAPYLVAPASDRTGFRLSGPAIGHAAGADILSDATPLGALQVPGNGQPILLMADRQTTGGYPKIATVIAADIPVVAQVPVGGRIEFALSNRREALSALIAQERILIALEGDAS
jgi:antagonist of KipI